MIQIAHRERTQVDRFLQRVEAEIIPLQYEAFGPECCSPEEIRDTIDSLQGAHE